MPLDPDEPTELIPWLPSSLMASIPSASDLIRSTAFPIVKFLNIARLLLSNDPPQSDVDGEWRTIMPQKNTRPGVAPDRGPGLLKANLNGNSIPAWGPFVYKVAIILTAIFLAIPTITTIKMMGSVMTTHNEINMLAVITALVAYMTQILVSICGLVLLKFVLEYLSRSARIEQKLNQPAVESFQ
jgi:hypothetical protein